MSWKSQWNQATAKEKWLRFSEWWLVEMLHGSASGGYFTLSAARAGEMVDVSLEKMDCQGTRLQHREGQDLCFAGTVLVWEAPRMLGEDEGWGTPACWRAIQ